jgi:hypothetical protein
MDAGEEMEVTSPVQTKSHAVLNPRLENTSNIPLTPIQQANLLYLTVSFLIRYILKISTFL